MSEIENSKAVFEVAEKVISVIDEGFTEEYDSATIYRVMKIIAAYYLLNVTQGE
jgi:GTPase